MGSVRSALKGVVPFREIGTTHGCCYRGKLKVKIRLSLHEREGKLAFHKD